MEKSNFHIDYPLKPNYTFKPNTYIAYYKCPLCGEIVKQYLPKIHIQNFLSDSSHDDKCKNKIEGMEHIILQLVGISDNPIKKEEEE